MNDHVPSVQVMQTVSVEKTAQLPLSLHNIKDNVLSAQVMQTAFVEKTAQLQALQQQLTGQQHASPELAALHQDMLDAQVNSLGLGGTIPSPDALHGQLANALPVFCHSLLCMT